MVFESKIKIGINNVHDLCVTPSVFVLVMQEKKMFWSNKLTAWILTM